MSDELLSEAASGGKAFLSGEENRLSEEIASSRLARAAEADSGKRKKKSGKNNKRKKKSAKKDKGKNRKSKKNQRKRKNQKKTAKKTKANNAGKRKDNSSKKKKSKPRGKSKKKKSLKGKGSSHNREGNDGNTIVIVCPECPKEKNLKPYANLIPEEKLKSSAKKTRKY